MKMILFVYKTIFNEHPVCIHLFEYIETYSTFTQKSESCTQIGNFVINSFTN